MRFFKSSILLPGLILPLLLGCASGKEEKSEAKVGPTMVFVADDSYHADYDIAMTVKSILSTLNEGEKLESDQYDFEGVMTDGQGHILYSDLHGAPGHWRVKVENPDSVVLATRNPFDLFPSQALREYITSTLDLQADAPVLVANTDSLESLSYYYGICRISFLKTPSDYKISISNPSAPSLQVAI